MQAIIQRARRFNRFYTGAIGMLDEGYLGSGFTLAEARVIYELASRRTAIASDLGAALGLDPGYLSRILKRLGSQGLILRVRGERDRRQTLLSLSPVGIEAFGGLDDGAKRSMAGLIAHLDAASLDRLSAAMDEIETLLGRPAVSEVKLRAPEPGDLGWVVERHAVHYARDQGWNSVFESLVARIVADMSAAPDPARERCWIAERDGRRLGCVFLAKETDQTARLRLLMVEPAARGLGLGRQLSQACVAFAREAGYREIVLWTHAELTAARRIYASLGFELIDAHIHHDFGPPATSETWRLALG